MILQEENIKGNRIEGRMYNKGYAKRYAGVVELGRKAGSKRPPTAPLEKWLMVKKGLSKKEASRAAYGLSIHIARKELNHNFSGLGIHLDLR